MEQNTLITETHAQESEALVVEVVDVDNAVMQRLIDEVRNEQENRLHTYNRQHNRHNRGR